METVSIRDLRNQGGDVVSRVTAGEALLVTRDGEPVAELRPIRRAPLSAATLLEQWRSLPPIDEVAWRRDIDAIVDQSL